MIHIKFKNDTTRSNRVMCLVLAIFWSLFSLACCSVVFITASLPWRNLRSELGKMIYTEVAIAAYIVSWQIHFHHFRLSIRIQERGQQPAYMLQESVCVWHSHDSQSWGASVPLLHQFEKNWKQFWKNCERIGYVQCLLVGGITTVTRDWKSHSNVEHICVMLHEAVGVTLGNQLGASEVVWSALFSK